MDFGSHLLSGVIVCLCKTDNPDPLMNWLQNGLILFGSVMPDIPVNFIWKYVAKKVSKGYSTIGLQITKQDYDAHAGNSGWPIKIYKILHGLPFLLAVVLVEIQVCGDLFASWGIFLHQFYDLFTHKYESDNINPKPFYPLSGWTFRWGLADGWLKSAGGTWTWSNFIISWVIHLWVMAVIVINNHIL